MLGSDLLRPGGGLRLPRAGRALRSALSVLRRALRRQPAALGGAAVRWEPGARGDVPEGRLPRHRRSLPEAASLHAQRDRPERPGARRGHQRQSLVSQRELGRGLRARDVLGRRPRAGRGGDARALRPGGARRDRHRRLQGSRALGVSRIRPPTRRSSTSCRLGAPVRTSRCGSPAPGFAGGCPSSPR